MMAAQPIKRKIRSQIDRVLHGGRFPLEPAMEAVYQTLFNRDLAGAKIDARFYPVGGAANHALCYLILRICREFPLRSVLELGAGETTRLFDALAKAGHLQAEIRTLEHDAVWQKKIAAEVQHPVQLVPLVPLKVGDHAIAWYDRSVLNNKVFDLIVVDGPPAASEDKAFARLGAVTLTQNIDPKGAIILLDDTHRAGEIALVADMEKALNHRGIAFNHGQIITNKRVTIFTTGAYAAAAYF